MIGVTPGLGPESLEGNSLSGYRVAFNPEVFSTPLLDITQTLLGLEFIPARFGHIPMSASSLWSIESVAGVQTVPAQIQAGSDPAHSNVIVSVASPLTADVNAANPPSPSSIAGSLLQPLKVQEFPGLPVFLDITSGAQGTGGFKCMARLVVHILWTAVGM
jgi:hypothetical protein